jgi:ParB-like chromosome segregation protein Spo0J
MINDTLRPASPRMEALDNIVPDPDQPRKRFLEGPLAELAESLWAQGLTQPVTVTAGPGQDGLHVLFIGERRWRAFQINRERARCLFEAGEELPADHPAHRYERWTQIPVLYEPPMEPADRILKQVSENDDREDLSLYERALAYQKALSLSRLKAKDFAARYGIDPGTLSTYKGLVNAKGPTKLALELGLLNDAHAARLFQTLPKDLQEQLIQKAEEEETPLSRLVVQRALDAVEAAQERAQRADQVSEEPHAKGSRQTNAASSRESARPAKPLGPNLSVEALTWLQQYLEQVDAGEDDRLRLEALEALRQAVLNDSPYIAILDTTGVMPGAGIGRSVEQEVLQET